MRHSQITAKILNFLDYETLKKSDEKCRGSLCFENCFSPHIAIANIPDRETCLDATKEYFIIVSKLADRILKKEPVKVAFSLHELKINLSKSVIPLSDFVTGKNLFLSSAMYLTPAEKDVPTIGEFLGYTDKEETVWSFFGDVIEMICPPDELQEFEFVRITETIESMIYGLLSPCADPESKTLMMQLKWDDIDLEALGNYISHRQNEKSEVEQVKGTEYTWRELWEKVTGSTEYNDNFRTDVWRFAKKVDFIIPKNRKVTLTDPKNNIPKLKEVFKKYIR